MVSRRQRRRSGLQALLEKEPFLTDRQIAELLEVSVATVRLDRMALGIPELRERIKAVAEENYAKLRALEGHEVIGELIDLSIGREALSVLTTTPDMTFKRADILRGHYLFAQANSLAVALVDAEIALTASARIRFLHPVAGGRRVVAKAKLEKKVGSRHTIKVESRVEQQKVFEGDFVVVALEKKESDTH
ncbi:MAG: transcription factor FapR [Limnochordia bacterium]|jgi:acyl-coenzyme A thioesterase PaaI-like protein|nr:transcription factor FapR [Bacillota bacterium]HOB08429.1 transcription factor FapR [Limnochordia bacterium]NLH30273.1 transcription factor FapR [Bacillota bacterium]HPT92230.1 transcription factor FapR [Limnochordia bacterium]HPZ30878.1 transcription factor FapR [Limnochordia bacterium]